jgi:hypothetical protein
VHSLKGRFEREKNLIGYTYMMIIGNNESLDGVYLIIDISPYIISKIN